VRKWLDGVERLEDLSFEAGRGTYAGERQQRAVFIRPYVADAPGALTHAHDLSNARFENLHRPHGRQRAAEFVGGVGDEVPLPGEVGGQPVEDRRSSIPDAGADPC